MIDGDDDNDDDDDHHHDDDDDDDDLGVGGVGGIVSDDIQLELIVLFC